MVMSPQRMAYV